MIAPEPNIALGCTLLGLAVLLIFVAMCRMFQLKKFAKYIAAVVYFGIAFGFGYFVLFKPLRGKEFKTLLVAGYQIVSECQVIPANTQTPDWLHDQEERWRGKVTEAVDEKLDYRSAQLWHGAIVYGLVTDKDTNGYRCSQMAVSTDALEQIIAKKYDPSLPHKQYSGPVYQLHQPK